MRLTAFVITLLVNNFIHYNTLGLSKNRQARGDSDTALELSPSSESAKQERDVKHYFQDINSGLRNHNTSKYINQNDTTSFKVSITEQGPSNISGITRDIWVDPRDSTFSTWLCASSGGGIWKTIDSGENWNFVSEEIPSMHISSIEGCASQPDIIYTGTGEGLIQNSVIGTGIYKSTDSGESWTSLAFTQNNTDFNQILSIVVHPSDPEILIAATKSGLSNNATGSTKAKIMKSTDGGQTWYQVFENDIDLLSYNNTSIIEQIIPDPTDFNNLYASINSVGIIRSTDQGETWEESIAFYPDEKIGRLSLAIAPSDPSRIYFTYNDPPPIEIGLIDFGRPRLYTSDDKGLQWTLVDIDFEYSWFGDEHPHSSSIAVNPNNPLEIYVGGTSMQRIHIDHHVDSFLEVDTIAVFSNENEIINIELDGRISNNVIQNESELRQIEIRFGPSFQQKAHLFDIGPGAGPFLNYIEVPFEVWDIRNNRQLMVSIFDKQGNGTYEPYDISDFGIVDYLYIHNTNYSDQPSLTISNSPINEYLYSVFIRQLSHPGDSLNGLIRMEGKTQFSGLIRGNQDEVSINNQAYDFHQIQLFPSKSGEGFKTLIAGDYGVAYSEDSAHNFVHSGNVSNSLVILNEDTLKYKAISGYNTSHAHFVEKLNGQNKFLAGFGSQGIWLSPQDSSINSPWTLVTAHNGTSGVSNYDEPNHLIVPQYPGELLKSVDGGESWNEISLPNHFRFANFNLAHSKQRPNWVYANASSGIIVSKNFGDTWESTQFTSDIYGTPLKTKISLVNPSVIWVLSTRNNKNQLFVSSDLATTFYNVSLPESLDIEKVLDIITHPRNPNSAFVITTDSNGPKILRTNDLGFTWTDISGYSEADPGSSNGLPDSPVRSLLVMPHDPNIIWAGTDFGVYESTNNGANWNAIDLALPQTQIKSITIVNDHVLLGTGGRGIWTVKIPESPYLGPQDIVPIPSIDFNSNSGFGNKILGSVKFDDTFIRAKITMTIPDLNTSREINLKNNPSTSTYAFHFSPKIKDNKIYTASISCEFQKGDNVYSAIKETKVYNVLYRPVINYDNNFDNNFDNENLDFVIENMTVAKPFEFENPSLHTPHPYELNTDHIALFQKPIFIASDSMILSYDDIALIVPDGLYLAEDIKENILVEASHNRGKTWTELDSYNSLKTGLWSYLWGKEKYGENFIPFMGYYDFTWDYLWADYLWYEYLEYIYQVDGCIDVPNCEDLEWFEYYFERYNCDQVLCDEYPSIQPKAYQENFINLSDYFSRGSLIYIRFKFKSNTVTNGWGWTLDNFRIENRHNPISKLQSDVSTTRLFPNPFNQIINLDLSQTKSSNILVSIYEERTNKLVFTQNLDSQSPEQQLTSINAKLSAPGIYIVKIVLDDKIETFKMIKT